MGRSGARAGAPGGPPQRLSNGCARGYAPFGVGRLPAMRAAEIRVGTAAWAIPRDVRERFDGDGSRLERYARRFACVEINSSFYRPHRPATYARWAASVPDDFRFALKVPKEITHTRRFVDVVAPLERFLAETAELGEKRGVLLVQLPPSFAYDAALVDAFFAAFRARYDGLLACEPRHPTWFAGDAGDALRRATSRASPPILPSSPMQAFRAAGTASCTTGCMVRRAPIIRRTTTRRCA